MDTYYSSDLLQMNKRSLMQYRILCYAIEQLKNPEFSGISVSRLCKDLKISRTSFYENFTCRRDLFLQVLKGFWDETAEHNGASSYRESLAYTINYIGDRRVIIRNIMKAKFTALDLTFVVKFLAQTSLRELEIQASVGRRIDFNPELVAAYNAGGFLHIISYWLNNDLKYTNEDILEALMKIYEGKAALFNIPDYRQSTSDSPESAKLLPRPAPTTV